LAGKISYEKKKNAQKEWFGSAEMNNARWINLALSIYNLLIISYLISLVFINSTF
jgi:hypothetical protein